MDDALDQSRESGKRICLLLVIRMHVVSCLNLRAGMPQHPLGNLGLHFGSAHETARRSTQIMQGVAADAGSLVELRLVPGEDVERTLAAWGRKYIGNPGRGAAARL